MELFKTKREMYGLIGKLQRIGLKSFKLGDFEVSFGDVVNVPYPTYSKRYGSSKGNSAQEVRGNEVEEKDLPDEPQSNEDWAFYSAK